MVCRGVQVLASNKGFTLWFTGLPCSGKTTLSEAVEKKLRALGLDVRHLDGDVIRKEISPNLGFSKKDREVHVSRVANKASFLTLQGVATLVSMISPYRAMRENARQLINPFIEVYVNCPLSVCEKRDVKGMYRLAREGKIKKFTGISDIYEEPLSPELVIDTHLMNVQSCVYKILEYLKEFGLIKKARKESTKV